MSDPMVKHAGLYWSVYARVRGAMRIVPPFDCYDRSLTVYRFGKLNEAGQMASVPHALLEKYRLVFNSTLSENRWTGPRPQVPSRIRVDQAWLAHPVATGLYTSLSVNDAVVGELTWGATKEWRLRTTLDDDVHRVTAGQPALLNATNFKAMLRERPILAYQTPTPLWVLDLSLARAHTRGFLNALVNKDPATEYYAGESAQIESVRDELRKAGYGVDAQLAYLASNDYSLTRALGQVIRDLFPKCRALRVTSARNDAGTQWRDSDGDNLLFFGPDGKPIEDLAPVRELPLSSSKTGPVLGTQVTQTMHGRTKH